MGESARLYRWAGESQRRGWCATAQRPTATRRRHDTLRGVKPEPSLLDETDDEAEAAADAEGLADIEAGRVVPHEDVARWLDTWGTPDETPPPASWRK